MSAEAVGWVFRHSPYAGDGLVVHLALADVANDVYGYELWLKRAEIGSKSRCSLATVDRALHNMRAAGYLEVLEAGGGRGNPTHYRLTKSPQNGGVCEPLFGSHEEPRASLKLHRETPSSARETPSSGESVNSLSQIKNREKTSGPTTFEPIADPAEHRRNVDEIRSRLRHPTAPPEPSS
jgi:hypothetical protein